MGWRLSSFSGKTEGDIKNLLIDDIVVSTVQHWEVASHNKEIHKCLSSAKVCIITNSKLT